MQNIICVQMGAGMITVKGKKVLVIGAGISGISAAALLVKNGAIPIIYDGNEKIKHDEVGVKLSRKIGTACLLYTSPSPRDM